MWVVGWRAALAALVGKRTPQKGTEGPAKATRRRPGVSTQASVQAPTASIAWRTQPYLSNAVGSVEVPPARHSPAPGGLQIARPGGRPVAEMPAAFCTTPLAALAALLLFSSSPRRGWPCWLCWLRWLLELLELLELL